jgi:hypothetical protein
MALRTVVLSDEAQEVLDRESTLHPRLDEVYRGLEWRLARKPEDGYQFDYELWTAKIDADSFAKTPALVVLYKFDENRIEVLRLLVQVRAA